MPTVTLQDLNDQETAIRAEIENLESQLVREMERESDPHNPFTAILTLKILVRQMLVLHKELERNLTAQIDFFRKALSSYGA